MEFDKQDIEAVAKSRVARAENKVTNGWIIGCVAAIVIGAFAMKYSVGIGWLLTIAGVVAFVYYMNTLSKKQSIYKEELVSEWEQEKEKK